MKIRLFMALLLLISVFHFSPLIVGATSSGEEETEEPVEEQDQESEEPVEALNQLKVAKAEDYSELQSNLVTLGFLTEDGVTGSLDNQTKEALRNFQQYYGLTVTGLVDEATTAKIDEILASPFQDGKRDSETIILKEYLVILGYATFENPTNYYGSQTAAAVRAFQSDEGLAVSGIIEPVTKARLVELATGPLQKGMYRDDAVQFKLDLEKLGFINWKNIPNNYFGPSTERAVIKLQKYYGIQQSGKADQDTLDTIADVLASPFQNGKNHKETVTLKEHLTLLDFANFNNPTTFFGSQTEAAVKAFQKDRGLPVSGIIEPITKAELIDLATKPLENGMRRNDAIELKKNLEKLGFVNWKNTPNNFYGPSTASAVMELQKYYSVYGLTPSGKADQKTLDAIANVLAQPLQNGNRHEDVVVLKEILTLLDYANFENPTTFFGPQTEAAVKAFQRDQSLPVSGIVEIVTELRMSELATKPLENGMRRNDAIEFKENLEKLGFVSWKNTPTNFYGPSTEQAVIKLQKYYGLPQTGKGDEATINKMEEVLASPYQKGKSNEGSIIIKQQLVDLGYLDLKNPTPLYGSQTEKAVKAFQRDYDLVVSGIAEEVTLTKLDEVLSNSLKVGDKGSAVIELKEQMNRLGFPINNTTNTFGVETEKAVNNFQKHYGLIASGVVNPKTVNKIESILASPFQYGVTHEDSIQLKKYLEKLGYVNWKNEPNGYYGRSTENAVKRFQEDNGLPVSGIIDEITLELLVEMASVKELFLTTEYNLTLQKALDIQMKVKPQSDQYYSGYVSNTYLKLYDGGSITGYSVNLRKSPYLLSNNIYGSVVGGTTFKVLDDNVEGDMVSHSKRWFKIEYQGEILYVHSSLANANIKLGETTARVNVRSGQGTSYHIYETVDKGTVFTVSSVGNNWHKVKLTYKWRNATSADTKKYLDPRSYVDDVNQKYQFLDLRYFTGAPASELDKLLEGAGKLEGKGAVFREAARLANINEIYLVSHAMLETGRGKSPLSDGSIKHNGKSVYNFFGIGANDHCAKECGTQRAIEEGWFTVDDAIIGGAQFAGEKYIHVGQHTLYNMRWNPLNMEERGKAEHQYATDIGWAYKQVYNYQRIYEKGNYNLIFDVPVYK
ncbi:peptidoglycan-binding protein [Ornithinibacillus halotolerans]|uniref:SH3b domain-containing protein n=1 Tax=Ornithinibacillus halotolerans TaxID=1274357 RepID=A0A916RQI2_9BACI|nr:peptidoglycan-binding protein [Ornithinibacillus halotolerans]GGA64830.1 hypothetical protein GCM10008025_05790 [Ornithinibacillus halotolerans]